MAPLPGRGRCLLLVGCCLALVTGGTAAPDAVDLCKRDAALCGLESFSGFLPLSENRGSLFYWYFPGPNSSTAQRAGGSPQQSALPLVLWLQGGPGASSMMGLFFEHGPLALEESGRLRRRAPEETWASWAPLLFIDSPLGTGWSFASSDAAFARDEGTVAADLVDGLRGFRALHPEAPSSIVLTGESYGGHFLPALGARLLMEQQPPFSLAAVAIGDGFTDPATQVLTKPQEAYAFALIDEKQLAEATALASLASNLAITGNFSGALSSRLAMEELVSKSSGINLYDVRTTQSYDWQDTRLNAFFGDNHTKDMLHIPRHVVFGASSDKVEQFLADDIMRSQKPNVEALLNAGIRVLLYQGQFDWKDGVVSNERWIRSMAWPGVSGYLKAPRALWRRASDGELAGYWRRFKNLEQVVVLGAGHLVPMDQPRSARDMLVRFVTEQWPEDADGAALYTTVVV